MIYIAGLFLYVRMNWRKLIIFPIILIFCIALNQTSSVLLSQIFKSDKASISVLKIALTGENSESAAHISQDFLNIPYCSFENMDKDLAMQKLENGQISGVLLMPDDFIKSIRYGENFSPTLIVNTNRPFESFLVKWMGTIATQMLLYTQKSMYAIQSAYTQNKKSSNIRSIDDVVNETTILYVKEILTRNDKLDVEIISRSGDLPIDKHYIFSIFAYLIMLQSLLFVSFFNEDAYSDFFIRLKSAGKSALFLRLSFLLLTLLLSFVSAIMLLTVLDIEFNLSYVLCLNIFVVGFCAFFTVLLKNNSMVFIFLFASISLFIAGGIIPPAILPQKISALLPYSPITLMRQTLVNHTFSAIILCVIGVLCGSTYLYASEKVK